MPQIIAKIWFFQIRNKVKEMGWKGIILRIFVFGVICSTFWRDKRLSEKYLWSFNMATFTFALSLYWIIYLCIKRVCGRGLSMPALYENIMRITPNKVMKIYKCSILDTGADRWFTIFSFAVLLGRDLFLVLTEGFYLLLFIALGKFHVYCSELVMENESLQTKKEMFFRVNIYGIILSMVLIILYFYKGALFIPYLEIVCAIPLLFVYIYNFSLIRQVEYQTEMVGYYFRRRIDGSQGWISFSGKFISIYRGARTVLGKKKAFMYAKEIQQLFAESKPLLNSFFYGMLFLFFILFPALIEKKSASLMYFVAVGYFSLDVALNFMARERESHWIMRFSEISYNDFLLGKGLADLSVMIVVNMVYLCIYMVLAYYMKIDVNGGLLLLCSIVYAIPLGLGWGTVCGLWKKGLLVDLNGDVDYKYGVMDILYMFFSVYAIALPCLVIAQSVKKVNSLPGAAVGIYVLIVIVLAMRGVYKRLKVRSEKNG